MQNELDLNRLFISEQDSVMNEFYSRHNLIVNQKYLYSLKADDLSSSKIEQLIHILKYQVNYAQMNEFLDYLMSEVPKKIHLQTLVDAILQNVYPTGLTIKMLSSYLSKAFLQKELKDDYYIVLKNLRTVYQKLCGYNDQVSSYFYFTGLRSGMQVTKRTGDKITWPFINGFGFVTWFKIFDVQLTQKIFTIQANYAGSNGIECFISGGSLYYRILSLAYSEPVVGNGTIMICKVVPNEYHFLGICHEPSKKLSFSHNLQVYFDNDNTRSITLDFPRVPQGSLIQRFTLYENTLGMVQSVMMFSQPTSKIKQLQQILFGMYTSSQVKSIPAALDKHTDRVWVIFIPERTQNKVCWDICTSDVLAQIYGMGGVMDYQPGKFKLGQVGGLETFIGFGQMILACNSNDEIKIQSMIEIWRIINILLKNRPQLQHEAAQQNIFCSLAGIISTLKSPVVSTSLADLLSETKLIINDVKLIDQFFIYILTNPLVIQQCLNPQVVFQISLITQQYYVQNQVHFNGLVSLKELLDLSLFALTEDNRQTQSTWVEKIVGLLPQFCEALLPFLEQYFLCLCSPKVKISLIESTKNFLMQQKQDVLLNVMQQWLEQKVVYSILFMFQNTISVELQSTCIDFLNLVFQQKLSGWGLVQQEAIAYLENYFKERYNQLANISSVRELKNIALETNAKFEQLILQTPRRIEQQEEIFPGDLKNLGTQFLNNDYESIPQAPSMINKRKPDLGSFFTCKRALEAEELELQLPQKRGIPSLSVDSSQTRVKKRNFNIIIDTDAINSMYSYGGEKGKKKELDEEAFQEEFQQTLLMARQAVLYMKGERKNKEDNFYEGKVPLVSQPRSRSIARQAPVSTRHKIPQLQFNNELGQIKEQSSLSQTNSSLEMKQQQQQQFQKKIEQPKNKEQQIQVKMNVLYESLLGWVTNKLLKGKGELDPFVIEEGDIIHTPQVISIIIELYNTLPEADLLKVQIMQDLLCLAKTDSTNSQIMLQVNGFHQWLLRSLLQVMPFGNQTHENNKLTWEIGCRLHTSLMITVLPNWGQSKLEELLIWAEGKGKKVKCQLLIRYLFACTFDQIHDQTKKHQPDPNLPLWNNLLHQSFNIVQLVVGVGMREISIQTKLDMLMYVKDKDQLPKINSLIEQPSQWVDLHLVLTYINSITPLFQEFQTLIETHDKLQSLRDLFENQNSELFQKIHQVLLTKVITTPTFILEFYRLLYCLFEALTQNGIRDANLQRIYQAIKGMVNLCVSISITSESMLIKGYLVDSSVNENVLTIYNFIVAGSESQNPLLRSTSSLELANLNQILTILKDYIKQKGSSSFVEVALGQRLSSNEHQKSTHWGLTSEQLRSAILGQNSFRFQVPPTEPLVNIEKILNQVVNHGENRQCELEEQRRIILMMESEKQRQGKNALKKNWKRISTFRGYFAPQDFFKWSQVDIPVRENTPLNFMQNPYFTLRIEKLTTKSKARPFLKIKLITRSTELQSQIKQPVLFGNQSSPLVSEYYVQLLNQQQQQVDYGPQQLVKAANQIVNMGRFWGNHVKNTIKTILPKQPSQILNIGNNIKEAQQLQQNLTSEQLKQAQDDVFMNKKVQWIRTLTLRTGFLSLSYNYIIFQYEFIQEKASHLSLLPHQLTYDRRLIKQWSLEQLKEVQRKKYLQRRTAIELSFCDGQSIFINFMNTQDMEEVSMKLVRLRKTSRCPNLTHYKTMDPRKIPEKSGLTKNWQSSLISNFSYLMQINLLASRSYNDITQYPVFPWVITENNQSTNVSRQIELYPSGQFRNLKLTMGLLGSEQRIKSYLERYESADSSSEIPSFHFGSHYSSPAITSQYLLRVQPFTQAAKEIQGGRFDIADRLFFSMIESYRCATEDIADVRELIPEAFCMPEMFLNCQNLNLGKTQSNIVVSSVQLPAWAKGNPFKYVVGIRQALESDHVSLMLPEWLDLIFGFKQRGKEAVKALNTFFYLTYDDAYDFDHIPDPHQRVSVETQVINFGITPLQLFNKQHLGRVPEQTKTITSLESEIKVYRPTGNKKRPSEDHIFRVINFQRVQDRAIIKIKWVSQAKLIFIRRSGTAVYLKWWSLGSNSQQTVPSVVPFQCGVEKEKQLQLERQLECGWFGWDRSIEYTVFPLEILNYGKYLFIGGQWDGRLIIINSENGQQFEQYQQHTTTITVIVSDKKEQFLITGSLNGNVILWKIDTEFKITPKKQYFDHDSKINLITISMEMNIFVTACDGGYINMYNIWNGKFMRTIRHPQIYPINMIVLSSQPLCCLVFQSSIDQIIYTYNINGFLVEQIHENSHCIISPQVIRDKNFQESLVYGTENGDLVMRSLPFLQSFRRYPISTNSPVLSITTTKDKKFLLCGCNDGEISILTEPPLKQQQSSIGQIV